VDKTDSQLDKYWKKESIWKIIKNREP